MHCLFCKKEKSLFQWWFTDLYCTEEHRDIHAKEMQDKIRKRQHLEYLAKGS